MKCPFCQCPNTQVRDSRPAEDDQVVRRRRTCERCAGRFTTFERVQLRELVLVKKNGRREIFDREKLVRSVSIALRKRPIPHEQVEHMISGVVRRLETLGESEIYSDTVGQLLMEALRQLDEVAYVRYASVYKNFKETKDFQKFIGDELFPHPPPPHRADRDGTS